MRRPLLAVVSCAVVPLALAAAGCASRRPPAPRAVAAAAAAKSLAPAPGRSEAEIRAGFAAAERREPHLTMLSQEAAHEAMPELFKGVDMPTLALVGGHQPRSMEAVLAVARAARREGDLDNALLNDVFWAVSSANDCFY
jgi:hypothetical protein